jgi:arginine decarboxylase-like protein
MKITKTDIRDLNFDENDRTINTLLLKNLVEKVSDLFYEETRKKQEQLSANATDIEKLKNVITEYRKNLLYLKENIKSESLKNKILKEIESLRKTYKISEKMKITITEIISTIDGQSVGKLEEQLGLLQKIVNVKKRIK